MNQQRAIERDDVADRPAERTSVRDEGMSLVETLVAIVLTGTLAVAGMVCLRASIVASGADRDHANAHAWLQTASDVIYGAELVNCGTQASTNAEAVAVAYEAIARGTSNPQGWPPGQISVVRPVKFWDGTSTYQGTCYDDAGINLQLIQLQVKAPDGRIVESVEIVKG